MLQRLLNTGVTDQLDFYERREVKILNLFAFIVFCGLAVGASNIVFLGDSYPALVEGCFALLTLAIPLLNLKGYYDAAAYFYVVYINLIILFINEYYDDSTATYLYYFPIIFCTALLHNPNKPIYRTLSFFAIITASFLVARINHAELFPKANLTAEQDSILSEYNIYFCALITIVLLYMVINLINRQYSEQADLLETVKKDQVTIANSLHEKEVLLAEVQHRVKNNLAVIIGLFNLQRDNATNDETRAAIAEAKNRVLSIAMVHERLYKKANLSRISLKNYIWELTKEIIRSHPLYDKITIEEDLEEIDADITKAVPVGLVVNEIITNSLKHAFKDLSKKPVIKIILTHHFGMICVKISDNGSGLPENMDKIEKSSIGLTLMESLAEQLDGTIHYSSENGTTVKLTFPV